MEKIRAYVDYEDYNKTHYYRDFKIIDKLPKIETTGKYNNEVVEINEVELDCEQGNEEAYKYQYYEIKSIDFEYYNNEKDKNTDIEDYTNYDYVAVKY